MRDETVARSGNPVEVFLVFLKLGLSCFGGPIAHLGYFRAEFVEKRKWLDEAAYADLVALCQFLPGPASSQTGFAIGLGRAGYLGSLAAWLGFTSPSAILLFLFAYCAGGIADVSWGVGLLHGLKLVAVAIVAQAVFGMARTLCPDRQRATIAIVALFIILFAPGSLGQISTIVFGGLAGLFLCRSGASASPANAPAPVSRAAAVVSAALFFVGLAISFAPVRQGELALFDGFYRSGALVFGGGHVVLPLLRAAVVAPGWVSDNAFLAGYGAAQAVPGPLFTFSAYLGAIARVPAASPLGALVAVLAIFIPGMLALMGALPFWHEMRRHPPARAAMAGVNAAVVGLLAAALYDPVWTSAVSNSVDFAIVAADFVLLMAWQTAPLIVVGLSAAAGILAAIAG